MAFADSSETEIAFIAEATFGITPATPAFQRMRVTSEDLTGELQTVVSNELRPDAEVSDLIRVGESATGNLPFELSFGAEVDTLLEHALRGSFAANTADTTVTAMSVGTTSTFVRAAGSFVTDGFKIGMFITSTGFTDAANNGTFLVREVAATILTVQESSLVVEGAGVDEQIVAIGSELVAGTEKKSFTFEKRHETGATDHYFRYAGCRIGGLSLTLRAQEIVTGSFSVQGLNEATGTAIISGATYSDANTNPVMAAPDVGIITVGGVVGTLFYTDLSFSLTNNLRAQGAIGQVGSAGIGYGRREVTGTITAYFEDADLYEEAVANNSSSIIFPITDGTNTYSITLPKLKFTSRRAVAGGNNQDILAECQFQALYDPTEQTSIKIVKS